MLKSSVIIAAVTLALSGSVVFAQGKGSVADQIRIEATRPNADKTGHPLPLACTWRSSAQEAGPKSEGWEPDNQIKLIENGHHLLLTFSHPPFPEIANPPFVNYMARKGFDQYYEAAIKRAAVLKLPIVFLGSQWESLLGGGKYRSLPANQNPNVVALDGTIQKKVSPFGPVQSWCEVGKLWTDNPNLKKLQEWYPDPPKVIFLSNNEHSKLGWTQVETSKRYLDKYGKGQSDDFKRKLVGDGWIERYRALQEGMRDGLVSEKWKQNAVFFAYGGDSGMEAMGRWGGWPHYSLGTSGRIGPGPLMWDGVSQSYYTHHWNPSVDFRTWSPQVEFQNLVFQNKLSLELNPDLWHEISTFDGHSAPWGDKARDKWAYYETQGQTFTPQRYAGMIQFGMWLLRPRSVREYRGGRTAIWEKYKPYFMVSIVDAVDRVHTNPTLRQWWRKGELVPNRAHEHHYQSDIPEEYRKKDRWFLLDANVNPQEYPWKLFWEVRVFAIALVRGEAPKRQWLVYAHSPLADRKDVKLTVPEYGEITVDVSIGGSFYEVHEADKSVLAVAR